jgi:hypothetical protein
MVMYQVSGVRSWNKKRGWIWFDLVGFTWIFANSLGFLQIFAQSEMTIRKARRQEKAKAPDSQLHAPPKMTMYVFITRDQRDAGPNYPKIH